MPPEEFVLAHTTPTPVPMVPEIVLHSAAEAMDLWALTEREQPPFWAFPWAGGQALARYVLDHPETVRDQTVLDLASGSGLVAIAAALAGAARVIANDVDPLSLAAIALNAQANNVHIELLEGDQLAGDAGGADVVLAGDAFYDRDITERVMPFLRRASAGVRQCRVLVGDPERAHLPRSQFTALVRYAVPVPLTLESTDTRPATVWTPNPP
ncbi:50S ribosomal protein L11 methyltransferase [Lentzea sp. NBRC 105346]|uniref:class I SAM-dependent methyltransferase n=1 Tax=Lentzea sp. NBRC 105346 TaxID=3032205 RepID=UPI0024A2CC2C|nr:50S ribosomal protein L11 methyltransferase [Lentzea sp. NBRC 105346]GLZ28333.1 50S ribosomal protein L11 methyltransferase [Lentzea sp. NBRC 105346]